MLEVTALAHFPPPRTSRRYTLADLLRGADSDRAVVVAALRWLEQQRGIHRCCIALATDDGHRLEVLSVQGGRGVARHASIGREEIANPLVAALGWHEPAVFAVHETERAGLPWRGRSSYVSPLAAGEETFGFLIAATRRSEQRKIDRVSLLIAERLVVLRYARLRAKAQRLERENVRLQSILDILSDPILLTDAEGHMLAANGAAERLFAADESASEGRRRAVALNNMLFSSAAFTTVGTADAGKREILLVDPSAGDDLLYELLSSPLGQGDAAEVAHILRDVNDLRLAAQQIEENSRRQRDAEAEAAAERDRLDSILNAVAAPILVTDASGNIERMNEPAARLFTVDRGTCTDIMLRRVRANDAVWSSFVASTRIGIADPARAPLNLVAPVTGEPLPVEAVARRVPSKQGDVAAVVVILNDRREALEKARLYEQVRRHSDELDAKVREATAELVAQNELLRRQALALEEASAAKTRFLANMSHELRTPLHAVIGYADLLLRRGAGELAEAHRRKLERLLANAKHLLALISDLLDLSRIEAGKMPLHLTDVHVEMVLREAMADLEPLLARAALRLEGAIDPLPVLRTDAQKLKQIILNLLSNAIKFTPAGFVRIAARDEASLAEIQIQVTDSGIGIAPADLERIFEDFNQADSSYTRPYGGTGLGLSICRRLAAMLDGRVSVASRPGEGSTFTLHLPRTRGAR